MQIPIRILVTDITSLPAGVTWGDVITNWEAYMLEWQESAVLPSVEGGAPILDFYEDASLSIKEIVKDLKDPKKLFTDFSRDITLPASKKNNVIFKHYYNLDIDNGFDARVLVPCKILMNNEVYKVGNLALESVKMANGVPQTYTVRFYGKLTELSKKMGEDKVSELPMAVLNNFNPYTKFSSASIQDVVFPLSSRENRFKWNSDKNAYNSVDKTKTIKYIDSTRNAGKYGIEPSDIVGAVKVGYLLSSIESKYGVTFAGAVKQPYIDKLYMWLSNYKEESDITQYDSYVTNLSPTTTSFTGFFPTTSSHTFSYLGGNTYKVRIKGIWTGSGKVVIYQNGSPISESTVSNTFCPDVNVVGTPQSFTYRVFSTSAQTVNVTIEIEQLPSTTKETFTGSAIITSVTNYDPREYVPEITVMDFLSSIFSMFNIVAEVDDSLVISTKHYDAFMAGGSVKDIGNYVDLSDTLVTPPTYYSSISFGHKYGGTAIEEGFVTVNGREYGSLVYESTDLGGDRISGESYEAITKVGVIPQEQITDNLIHTYFGDVSKNKKQVGATFTYVMPNSLGVAWDNGSNVISTGSYLMPINLFDPLFNANTTDHLNGLYFGSELYAYNPAKNVQGLGLYNCFFRGLVGSLMDATKRVVRIKALLGQGFLKNLYLGDTLTIRGNFYHISSIETDYLTGVSDLELIQVGSVKNKNWSVRTATATNNTGVAVYITYMNSSGYLTSAAIPNTGSANLTVIGDIIRDTGGLAWTYA